MEEYYGISIVISIILFLVISIIKKKRIIWIFLLCIALLPIIAMLASAIYSAFNGSGLVGDSGGNDSAYLVIILLFAYRWYIYIPSLILLIFSFYYAFLKK